jgi:asparagine N-glycosylation enzyme membrane subunit Stt3
MRRLPLPRDILIVLAATILLQVVITVTGFCPWHTRGEYPDSDCYMRIQRVMNLYQSGAWYDSFERRSNAPFGEQLHWTRPLDILLYIGAWAGSFFTDFRGALWQAGVYVSPALLCLGLIVWRWGLRGVASPSEYVLSSLMLLLSPMFTMAFMIGRPDHHGLIALCLLGAYASTIRLLSGDDRLRVALYAGLWVGLGIWVSKESLVGAAAIGAALALLWIWQGGNGADRLAAFAQGMLMMLVIALPIEYPPSQWLQVRYARFTLVDVVFAAACALPWSIVARLPATTVPRRLLLTGLAGSTTLAIMAATYPRFLLGPTIDFTPAVVAWLHTVGEFKPLWPTSRSGAAAFALHLGPTVIAIGWCLWTLARQAGGRRKPVAFLLLVGNLAYLPLSLSAMRWAVSSNLLAALPWALAVSEAWRSTARLRVGATEIPLRSVAAAALIGGHVLTSAAFGKPTPLGSGTAPATPVTPTTASDTKGAAGCDWKPISAYLSARWPQGGVLFSYLFAGGELIWRTPFGVVGAPYGNDSALADTNAFFKATDDRIARAILRRRHVDLVLLCIGAAEAQLYETGPAPPSADGNAATLAAATCPARWT